MSPGSINALFSVRGFGGRKLLRSVVSSNERTLVVDIFAVNAMQVFAVARCWEGTS